MSTRTRVAMVVVGPLVLSACSGLTVTLPDQSSSTPAPTVTVTAAQPPPEPSPVTTSDGAFADWAEVAEAVLPGVVRLQVQACDGTYTGSGFAVGDDLIMTAAHVVEGATGISVRHDDDLSTATLIASDTGADTALLRLDVGLGLSSLAFAVERPVTGEAVALMGFPGSVYDARLSQGVVSSPGARADLASTSTDGLIVTDAAVNEGNSGGPALNRRGEVMGLVTAKQVWFGGSAQVEGIGYVVPAGVLDEALGAWEGQEPLGAYDCDEGSYGTDISADAGSITVDLMTDDPLAAVVSSWLVLHGEAINTSQYEQAWALFTERMRGDMGGLETWEAGLTSSIWERVAVYSVDEHDDGSVSLASGLRTRQSPQDGPLGQTCSEWTMDYTMVPSSVGGWLIDHADADDPLDCS